MQRFVIAVFLGCATVLLLSQEPTKMRPIVSTTIDFLDYVFYDNTGAKEYYELPVWETRLQELASCGITKVYIRVNVLGTTLWPSKVSPRYGQGGRVHYDNKERGMRLVRTLERWDPLAETIRIGHQLGLEVWCWDSTWDESATPYSRNKYTEEVAKYGPYPLIDDWYYEHPGCWSRRDPRLDLPELPVVDVRVHPIASVLLVSEQADDKPCRIRREHLTLLVSEDGRTYTEYPQDFQAEATLNADGHPQLRITGLDIRSPYLKFHQNGQFDAEGYNMVFGNPAGKSCHIYDAEGNELAATWGQRLDRSLTPPEAPIDFQGFFERFAWDYAHYQLGVHAAIETPEVDHTKWLIGIPELLLPAVREHKVDRFRELAAYPFDGFLYNIRSHSLRIGGENPVGLYGFNPELVAEFQRRTGRNVLRDDYDREAFDDMRSEGLDRFLAECKALTGGRPLYMTIGVPVPGTIRTGIADAARWLKAFGMRYHVDTWIANGSVDGITILGQGPLPKQYVGRMANGKKLKINVFREMAFQPDRKRYNFEQDLNELVMNSDIDEIELYESLVLDEGRRKIIREALARAAAAP